MQARLVAERKRDEEAKVAALEAERRAEKEAAEKVAAENSRKVAAATVASKDAIQSTGNSRKVTESAIKLEERRLQIYKELAAKNATLGLGSNKEFRSHGMQIARRIKIQNNKLSHCVNPTGSFRNASFLPMAVTLLWLLHSQRLKQKKITVKPLDMKKKMEKWRKMENTDSYVERLSSYMKQYGALVQTEVEGVQNMHGLKEGWAWFARFLNALLANLYTAIALHSFLEMAGFTLYRRYKTQFKNLLKIISRDFVSALRALGDPKLNKIIMNIQTYLDSNQFFKEPV